MVALQMCIPYLQKLMVNNSPHLLLKEVLKDLHRGPKNIKWESKVLQPFNYISRIVRCLWKMYWAEIGKGHVIAFNILNIGRLKLSAAAMGGAKRAATIIHSIRKNKGTI